MEFEQELKTELLQNFCDLFIEVESCLCRLSTNGPDDKILNELFRAVHTIKGNASMVYLPDIINYTHQVEHVISRCREKSLSITPELCDALQVGMDRLRDLHYQETGKSDFNNIDFSSIADDFSALAQSEDDTGQWINKILGTGDVLEMEEQKEAETKPADTKVNLQLREKIKLKALENTVRDDLLFFQEISLQIDNQSQHWEGRSIQIFDWVQKVNAYGNSVVGYEQLAGATYLHDVGMTLIPNSIIDKKEKLSLQEQFQIRLHSSWGYNFLKRMQGWEEAATIVLQHHECENGSGYPAGLKGDSIHPGAKIIAIIDAFFSMTNQRADRSIRKTVLRAIAEINARKETQFDSYWVDTFNEMIRDEIRSGNL